MKQFDLRLFYAHNCILLRGLGLAIPAGSYARACLVAHGGIGEWDRLIYTDKHFSKSQRRKIALGRLPLLHDISFEKEIGTWLVPDQEDEVTFAKRPRFGMVALSEYSEIVVSLLTQWLALASKALSLLFLQLLESASQALASLHIVALTLSPRLLPVPSALRA